MEDNSVGELEEKKERRRRKKKRFKIYIYIFFDGKNFLEEAAENPLMMHDPSLTGALDIWRPRICPRSLVCEHGRGASGHR